MLLALLGAGVVMAQAAKAKAAMMEDRKQMMAEAKAVDSDAPAIMTSVKGGQSAEVKALEAQVAKLQADIKVLNTHLAQTRAKPPLLPGGRSGRAGPPGRAVTR